MNELSLMLVRGLEERAKEVLKVGASRYIVRVYEGSVQQQMSIQVRYPFYGTLTLAKIDVDEVGADVGLSLNTSINWKRVNKEKNPDMRSPDPCRISLSRPDFFDLFDTWLTDLDYISEPLDAIYEPKYKP